MSLFPAYADTTANQQQQVQPPTESIPTTSSTSAKWLENSSYIKLDSDILQLIETTKETPNDPSSESEVITKKSKSEKKKKRHRLSPPPPPVLEFNGDEEFYIDKKGAPQYRTVNTLHKPACPRYRLHFHRTYGGRTSANRHVKHFKRYFKSELRNEMRAKEPTIPCLDENTFTQTTTDLNRQIAQNPSEDSHWVQLVHLQDQNPYKWSKTFLSEKKLDILQRALFHHLGNETLYRLYVDIANASYPSFEVSKMIDKLLSKDPYNYVLWTAQILTTQCTMARCIVPDVLKIYEQCMQKMHRKLQDDSVMLKLFNNCALFLRQSGLNELFFALILLALELNVSPDKFSSLKPLEKDQQTLIEYEELVLQSGLPMNEIWLRIEKLRQSFNFLPCPENTQCSDPQRVVFNEDICYYIYPLQQRENSFYMILIILRLLKIPLVNTSSLRSRFNTQVENIGDTDAIEDILAVLLNKYKCPSEEKFNDFYEVIYELSKEVCVCPTFLNSTIGYEIYAKTVQEILLTCAKCFEQIDERKRILFILIWLRFERVLLILQKLANKLDAEYKKNLRSKVKNLFKKEQNRNVLNFYTEYALLEYELGDLNQCEVIFGQILTENDHDNVNSDLSNAYVCYVNILIKENQLEKALKVLMCYSLSLPLDASLEASFNFTAVRRQSGLKKLSERLEALIEIEKNVKIMELEQHFFSDFMLNLVRLKTWYLYILGSKLEAMANLETMLRIFVEKNERHKFIREQVYELLISLMQCDSSTCIVSNVLIYDKISQALDEFPENLFFLQSCSLLSNQPWFKIQGVMLRSDSILSIIFLIIVARIRFKQSNKQFDADVTPWNGEHNETTYKNRILNLLKSLEGRTVFQRNALYWRFYMRCLSDSRTPFETTKKCLLAALDDCPWNKAIYLDGAIFVPQELSHLQDLLIEKQLRVCALPEELEILRNNDVQI